MINLRIVLVYFLVADWWFCEAAALENGTKNFTSENNIGNESFGNGGFESVLPRRKWISELFYEARTAFRLNSEVNAECKRDFDLFKLHLGNQSTWAVKMLESSEWPLVGILYGLVNHMGNYDECLSISSYGIDGQYCLVEAMYNYPDALHSEVVENPDEKISSWEVVSMYGKNPVRINRKKLRFAVCIPSSCTPTDLKISLNHTLHPIFNAHELNITIDVDPVLCKIRDKPARPLGYYIVRNLFGAIFFLVICGTLYDVATFTGVEMKTEGGIYRYFIHARF
ncbi:uncharacterized protein LOC135839121 [Planococcus citri]|uniref:uncharacterized protein LOC135839121 n=1 Tax=Planococcus citri TaxID=170843 RepID=UPI0031F9767E